MTIQEFSHGFDTLLNSYSKKLLFGDTASAQEINLDEYEKSTFLTEAQEKPQSAEYLLPTIVDDLLKSGKADVSVLRTDDKWFGVTYKEDKDSVKKAFEKLVSDGVYESPLFA